MNVCVCPARRDGTRRCRWPVVQAADGVLVCGYAYEFAAMVLAALVDPEDDERTVNVVALLRDAASKGWRIAPPARRRT